MLAEGLTDNYIYTTFQRTIALREHIAGIRPASVLKTSQDRLDQYKRLRRLVFSMTPVVSELKENGSVVLYKYESFRPSGSHYDPTYLETLFALELLSVKKVFSCW